MNEKVFISYSYDDSALYSSICLAFDQSGISRRDVSRLSLGHPLAEELRAAIDECDVCVFIATTRSLKSQWCLAELGAFWGSGKKVIVYLCDPEIRESDIPPQFRGNLWTSNAADLLAGVRDLGTGRVRSEPNGYSVNIGGLTIGIIFGRIEEIDCTDDTCLVALPANEFFDDDCIHDSRSALGAFMQRHFKHKIANVQSLVRAALQYKLTQDVQKLPGQSAPSYGIGNCVFLARPLSSNLRIAMVSVTTQRSDEGLRADPAYLFEAAAALQRVMANHRLDRIYIPVLGSGHGGLKSEVSLACMVIAFGELRRRSPHRVKEVNIVVFRETQTSVPSIAEETVKRILDFASRFLTN